MGSGLGTRLSTNCAVKPENRLSNFVCGVTNVWDEYVGATFYTPAQRVMASISEDGSEWSDDGIDEDLHRDLSSLREVLADESRPG